MRRCRGLRPAERSVLLIALLVVAVVLRAAMIVAADVPEPLRVDAGQYARYAYNLVEHGVYSLSEDEPPLPDSLRPPGLPILLAICRVLAGEHGWYALCRWLQVLLSTATVLLSYRLARQCLAFAPSFVGAALVALSPHLVVAPMFCLPSAWPDSW